MNLFVVEMRRAMHRRVVRVLIVLACVSCAIAGIIAYRASTGATLLEMQVGDPNPALMRDWWIAGTADGVLTIASLFLLLGGFFGGASVAGAEWRAGTVTTTLTWEPRRVRMHMTRTAACAVLAVGISFALQVLFLASFLPAVFAHGSTADLSSAWWLSLLAAMARTSALTALAAVLGVALATLGRNTAFAVVTIFIWLAVIEGLVRANKPGLDQYLWTTNVGTVVPWAQLEDVTFERGPVLALGTVVFYVAAITVAATAAFRRLDIAGSS